MTSSKTMQRALYEIAQYQGGFFTAAQALAVGYAYPEQSYHVKQGNWQREARGVFRLALYPTGMHDDLIVLSLQTMNRTGEMQGVISYETALSLHEISDANPRRIHLTLPPGYRKQLPSIAYPHTGIVPPEDYEEWDGFRVTTPLRTILDVAASPVSWVFAPDAVRDALRMGMVLRDELSDAIENRPENVRKWIMQGIEDYLRRRASA
jgi:hypothetical protein